MVLNFGIWYLSEIIASFTLVVPLLMGIFNVNRLRKSPLIIVFVICLIYAVFEIIGWYHALNHLQNHFLFNILSYIDIVLWGVFYYLVFEKTVTKRIVVFLVTVTLLLTLWSHFGTGRDFNRMDSFALSIGSISLIAMSLLFFYQLLNNLEVRNIFIYPFFWINVAVIIYFSGSFFSFIFAEYIAFSQDKSITQYMGITAILLFFHRIFLAIGLWFSTTPIQSNLSSK